MLKKHMAACLVVTAFAAAPAFAQTSPSAPTDRPTASGSGAATSGSPAMQPGASGTPSTSPSTAAPANSSAMNQGGSQGQFMTQMQMGQMMASDLIGTRVVSTNNESIGDINDVIMDRNGKIMAAVVGVGGFLGIGEKDVAVPFEALEFANDQQANAMDNNAATTGSTATGQGSAGATSNSNMATNNAPAANSGAASSNNEPDRVVLRMTKAELQAAPAFKANGDNSANRSNTGATGAAGTGGTAPQQ
ncbi:PRC-barrel domain-containing protein [Microvirga guangxiensis]|uniref:Sporulation protein YlmC, PRC-barrel domain family n=1 Tax=Microvirga guangxiensis TaxID=549386 RepID=A0A1G5CCJ0_9HYPH|nr:PRC-barrel domain-containing protein [Microvirga guangxiensis]SCY00209.1 Sporulation protein YlmC, PRC-barrel domain family [Microvirga guangxiensis]